ncbi:MAG: ATP-binding protein [Bacteroidetes bacterium]|nr:ATP-binding protein [Bacteroidota bacterium]
MGIDLKTVVLIIGIIHFTQFVIFYHLYRVVKVYKGIGWWLLWCGSEIFGFTMLFLRGFMPITPFIAIFQNVFLVGGTYFVYIGVMRFFGKKENRKLIIGSFTVFFILLLFFIFIKDDISIRSSIISIALSFTGFLAAIALFQNRIKSIKATTRLTAFIFLVHGMIFLIRTGLILHGASMNEIFLISPVNLLAYFDALIVGLAWTFGLLVMVNQRLNADMSESRERFVSIFNMSPDAIAITRLSDSEIIECNSAFLTISGYSKEEATGKADVGIAIWNNSSDREYFSSNLREKGFYNNYETVFQRKDGNRFTGLISARLIDLDGKVSVLSVTKDISERKQADEARLETEKRHKGYASLMSELINRGGFFKSSLDENLRVISEIASKIMVCERTSIWVFNEDYSELSCQNLYLAGPMSHFKGEVLKSIEFPDYIRDLRKGSVIAASDVISHPVTSQLPAGYYTSNDIRSMMDVPLWLEGRLKGVVCFENTGKHRSWLADEQQFSVTIASMVSLSFEIAERKKAEADLVTAKEKAQEADRLKSAFLANMSHEIRTPMNSIVGFAQLLADTALSHEEHDRYTSIIQSRSDDLMHIINELLEISRIESGNAKVVKNEVDLNQLLDEIHTITLQKLQKSNRHELTAVCVKPFPANQTVFISDPYILKQVFTNLIDNALKFTSKGCIKYGYSVPENQTINCFVSDTGLGISKENQAVIFEHFRQADIEHAHLYGGTGLGLSICRGALALIGGTISVESSQGDGSTFRFTIPFEKVEKQTDNKTIFQSKKPKPALEQWPGKRLLLVEDEVSNMQYLQAILSKTGTELTCVYNGKQLREQYKSLNHFDLVLLDIRLPDALGWDLAREIKNIRPDLPVISQTAFAMSSDNIKSKEAGCDNYISKPISKDTLLNMLSLYLTP